MDGRTYAQTSATPPAHAHIPPGGPTFAQAAVEKVRTLARDTDTNTHTHTHIALTYSVFSLRS